jgi:hypothetical protein
MAYMAPPVYFVSRCICKIAITRMSGLLLIPLWRSAKCWTFGFPDGRHLASLFGSMLLVVARTTCWDHSDRDIVGGKRLRFLGLVICSSGDGNITSLGGPERCIRVLFGKTCNCMEDYFFSVIIQIMLNLLFCLLQIWSWFLFVRTLFLSSV